LGLVLLQKGKIDDGIAHYRSALQMQPNSWDAEYNLGTALLGKGQVDEAILHCERAVAMRPTDPDAQVSLGNAVFQKGRIDESIATLTNLAWLMATSQDASLRNGAKAVEFAGQADRLAGGTNTLVLRTLAAAYAENGEFANAIKTARSAIQLARMHGEDSLTTDLDRQIALYQLSMPYRETAK